MGIPASVASRLLRFCGRASCHCFAANQLRRLQAALAYTPMQRLREIALAGTELARATAATVPMRLLKIGAAIGSTPLEIPRPCSRNQHRSDGLHAPQRQRAKTDHS